MSYILPTRGTTCGERRPCLEEAHDLFCRFHRFPASRVIRTRCRQFIPPVLVHLGALRGLIYTSAKGSRGHPNTYIHFMEDSPLLTCDPSGTQLYILGGHYRVTPRGIEG